MIYQEKYINYVVSISFGMLILLCSIFIVSILASSSNQLILIPLLSTNLLLGIMLFNFNRFVITIDETQLHLQFGSGKLKKQFSLNEISGESLMLKNIP